MSLSKIADQVEGKIRVGIALGKTNAEITDDVVEITNGLTAPELTAVYACVNQDNNLPSM